MIQHGELLLSWEGNILTAKAKGPFNEEAILAGIVAVKKLVSTKNLDTWYRISFWDENTLTSPSALKLLKDTHEWFLDNGCQKTAIVVCNSIQQDVVEDLFDGTVKVFRIESNARKWLISQSNA